MFRSALSLLLVLGASCACDGCCSDKADAAEFAVERNDQGVTVKLDGEVFTEYLIDKGPKPILWPIVGPTGKNMTRAYPMQRIKGEMMDHPHHRSLWFTHGDVNGIDFWSESGKNGKIVHRDFVEVSGGAEAKIVTNNDWVDREGNKICEDTRTLKFHQVGELRAIDFDITIRALESAVTFGDTKEGSFGIRIPTSMDVERRPSGGKIVNSNGDTDGTAWAKSAAWVDYHGPVEGEELGIAVLNHPSSFRFPTHWHVRTYGLFAANPFGLHDFEPNAGKDGKHTLEPGESFTLRYRVLFHQGDEKSAKIAEAFEAYSQEK
ncbi:MAG: PmoA family protein [Pirellulales bacterium]|nr:PmoA family protein [Pirellulales bacterium]